MNILMSVKFIFKRYKHEFETIKDDINEKKEKKTAMYNSYSNDHFLTRIVQFSIIKYTFLM